MIRSATAVAAEAMGLGADLGTIEPGKLADLVIVDGDPLTSIADLRKTRRVIMDGVLYDVDTLMAARSRNRSGDRAELGTTIFRNFHPPRRTPSRTPACSGTRR